MIAVYPKGRVVATCPFFDGIELWSPKIPRGQRILSAWQLWQHAPRKWWQHWDLPTLQYVAILFASPLLRWVNYRPGDAIREKDRMAMVRFVEGWEEAGAHGKAKPRLAEIDPKWNPWQNNLNRLGFIVVVHINCPAVKSQVFLNKPLGGNHLR